MSAATLQPIAGVPAGRESVIEVVYPSVAVTLLGRLIGTLMGAAAGVPTTFLRIIFSLLVGATLMPLALLTYFLTKLFGKRYIVTNQAVKVQSVIGGRTRAKVLLGDVDQITLSTRTGYSFHRVGDLVLQDSEGHVLLTLQAIPFPERLRQVILTARSSRLWSDESLSQIKFRATASASH